MQTPDYQGAVNQGYQAQLNSVNAQNAASGNFWGGLMGLGGMLGGAAIMKSDARLKSNVVKVGDHPLGVGIYEYDIDGERQRGVMAQELIHVKPEAVLVGDDGFYRVNYGML